MMSPVHRTDDEIFFVEGREKPLQFLDLKQKVIILGMNTMNTMAKHLSSLITGMDKDGETESAHYCRSLTLLAKVRAQIGTFLNKRNYKSTLLSIRW